VELLQVVAVLTFKELCSLRPTICACTLLGVLLLCASACAADQQAAKNSKSTPAKQIIIPGCENIQTKDSAEINSAYPNKNTETCQLLFKIPSENLDCTKDDGW
jgi:hypothetical protein